jgi:hypothetical protein
MTYKVKLADRPNFGTSTGQCAPYFVTTDAVEAIKKNLKANPQVDARRMTAFGAGDERSLVAEIQVGQKGQASGAGDERSPVAADHLETATPSTSGVAISAAMKSDEPAGSAAMEAK